VKDPAELARVAEALRRDPAVATVERNGVMWSRLASRAPSRRGAALRTKASNDPLAAQQAWSHGMIDLPQAWDLTTGSPSVLVAVVDDGILFDHPDIAANLTTDGHDFVSNFLELSLCAGGTIDLAGDGDGYDSDPTTPTSYDFDRVGDCLEGPSDLGGHGLSLAGIIGAAGNDGAGISGINWAVRIRPVRVLGVYGAGFTYDVVQGLLYAAGLPADDGDGGTVQAPTPAKIINLSFSSPFDEAIVRDAVLAATNAGALLVSGAGNSAASDPEYPGAYDEVLSTTALGPDRELASYSSSGPTVDIAAPGGDFEDGDASFGIFSTGWDFTTGESNYFYHEGFSPAVAHVTGVAALVLAQTPGLTPSELRARLTDYAVDAGPPGRDDQFGAGILNARNSLAQNLGPPRQLSARLYDALTGGVVQTVAVAEDGSYSFPVNAGSYHVFAGQDESGDGRSASPGGAGERSAVRRSLPVST
jgi:serine protease